MRPLRIRPVRMMLFAGVSEAVMYGAMGVSITTGLTGLGLSWMAAAPAAIVTWNVAARVAQKGSQAGINAIGYGIGYGAGKAWEGAQSGLRAMRVLVRGHGNEPGVLPDRAAVPLVHAGNAEALGTAIQTAAAGRRPVMIDTIFTEEGYQAFMESAKRTKIPVIDLDGLDESRAARTRQNYTDVAEPIAEIMRRTEQGPLTVSDVTEIIDRTAGSDISAEHKQAIYTALDAELLEERSSLEAAKATRLLNSTKADQAIREMDDASLQRLRDNADIATALEEMGLVREPDRYFQALQRGVEREGVEATLNKLRENPAQFIENLPPQGTTARPGWLSGAGQASPSPADNDGAELVKEPEMLKGLVAYVENIGAIKDSTAAVIALRERQQALEAALAERTAAIETVEVRIKRETALLDPQTQRQILREGLEAIVKSRETAQPELVQAGMTTAHAEEREADVRTMHEVSDSLNAVQSGGHVADVRAHTQSEIVLRGFESMATQAVGRFYEAHPEKDPDGVMSRAGREAAGSPGLDADAHRLGDILVLEGFGRDDDAPSESRGRNIRTRTRRAKSSDQGVEV